MILLIYLVTLPACVTDAGHFGPGFSSDCCRFFGASVCDWQFGRLSFGLVESQPARWLSTALARRIAFDAALPGIWYDSYFRVIERAGT